MARKSDEIKVLGNMPLKIWVDNQEIDETQAETVRQVHNSAEAAILTLSFEISAKPVLAAVFTSLSLQLVYGICAPAVEAADFGKASQVYAEPSAYDRRVDYSAIREQYAVPSHVKKALRAPVAPKSAPKSASNNASGKTSSPVKGAAKTVTAAAPKSVGTMPKISSIDRSAVKTTLPPPALSGKINGQSYSEIARHLSSRAPAAVAKMKTTARELVKSGKLDEAQRVYTKISQLTPQDKENLKDLGSVSLQRAKQYLKSENYSEAIVAARQTLAIDPANTEAHGVLSQLYTKAGENPLDVNARLKTADALYSAGRYHEAEVEYKASLGVKPTPEAHVGLGKVAEKTQGAGQGKHHFEKALELDSNSHHAHRELGIAHLTKGDVVSANSALSRAVILNPNDKEAGKHLVNLWQNQLQKMPNANSHLGLARAYQLTGDLPNSQAEYREVVRLDPNHPYLGSARQSFKLALAKQEADKSFTAARTLESQGLLSDAYVKASEAVNYSAGNANYKIYQGELLERMGQSAQARTVYMNVLKDDPKNLTAAQKISQIPAGAGNAAGIAGSVAGGMAGGMGALGGLLPTGHPAGFPGTKFPFPTNPIAPNFASGAGAAPVDSVGSLSNFIGQVRNHALTQKVQQGKIEDAAHKIIKQLTDPEPEKIAGGAGAIGGAEPSPGDEDFLNKILNSPVGSALPGKAAVPSAPSSMLSATGGGGAASAPKSMLSASGASAAPVGASAGESAGKMLAMPAGHTPASAKAPVKSAAKSSMDRVKELERKNSELQAKLKKFTGTTSAAPTSSAASSVANASSFAPQSAPPIAASSFAPQSFVPQGFSPETAGLAQTASNVAGFAPQASSFAQQAASFAPQASSFAQQAASFAPQAASFLPQAGSFAPQAASAAGSYAPQIASAASTFVPQAGSFAPQAAYAPQINSAANAFVPQAAPDFTAPATGGSFGSFDQNSFLAPVSSVPAPATGHHHNLRGPLPSTGTAPVRFELKQIKPTLTNVQLRVVLRNDGDQALNIPENLQAIIRYPDMHESEVKIAFDNKSIPGHGSMDGLVKVPFDKVDPSADLVLRNFSSQEIHLITSVVQRP